MYLDITIILENFNPFSFIIVLVIAVYIIDTS